MVNLELSEKFAHPASEEAIDRTVKALKTHGMDTFVVETAELAREQVLKLIPTDAEVYNAVSRTLELVGLADDIENSAQFRPVRSRLQGLDRVTQQREIRRLTASPDILVGSVHAITENGQVMIASAMGNQLGAAVWGAGKVIWVVGTQKLVPTLDDGFRRIREYSYPLEDLRARQIYGQPSAINKLVIINGEMSGRISIVLVKQNIGF